MNRSNSLVAAALAAVMSISLAAPSPARADGAASTRNIIFGAAAIGGTLLIINHNKKVHQKYAEYDQRQARTESERNQAQAAYAHESQAYANESALVHDLQREVAYQHNAVRQRDKEIASLKHSLTVAKYGRGKNTAYDGPSSSRYRGVAPSGPPRKADVAQDPRAARAISYGWGSY